MAWSRSSIDVSNDSSTVLKWSSSRSSRGRSAPSVSAMTPSTLLRLPDFQSEAAPTEGCFGLLERGADELAESYQEFHTELLAFATDLATKLGETATGLRESATRLGAG
jgi:hypothetical protein